MRFLVRLLPVWLVIILLSAVLPAAVRSAVRKSMADNLQEIDEITYTDHDMNECFATDIYDLTVLSAEFANDSRICDILPEGYALLVIKISGTSRGNPYQYYDNSYGSSYNTPYVTDHDTCYARIGEYDLTNYEDNFVKNQFSFFGLPRQNPAVGYLCYIVRADSDEFYLCLEEFETLHHTKHLTRVNRVRLETGGENDV